jgi:hypothetical protein
MGEGRAPRVGESQKRLCAFARGPVASSILPVARPLIPPFSPEEGKKEQAAASGESSLHDKSAIYSHALSRGVTAAGSDSGVLVEWSPR